MLSTKREVGTNKSLKLSQEAITMFTQACKDQEVEIEIKYGGKQVCSLTYNIVEEQIVNKAINNKVSYIVEDFLNELPRIQTVQNKL